MKVLYKGALFLAIIGTTIIGCEKESLETSENTVKTNVKNKSTTQKLAESGDGQNSCAGDCVNPEAEKRSIDTINLTPAYAVESQILETSTKGLEYQQNYYDLTRIMH